MGDVIIICLQAFVLHYTLRNRKSSDYQDRKAQFYYDCWVEEDYFFPHISFQVGKPAGGLDVKEAKPKHHLVRNKKSQTQKQM